MPRTNSPNSNKRTASARRKQRHETKTGEVEAAEAEAPSMPSLVSSPGVSESPGAQTPRRLFHDTASGEYIDEAPPHKQQRASSSGSRNSIMSSRGVFVGARIAKYFDLPDAAKKKHTSTKKKKGRKRRKKQVPEQKIYFGTVVAYRPYDDDTPGTEITCDLDAGLYQIHFDDGDFEILEPDEVYQAYRLHNSELDRLGLNMRGYYQLLRSIRTDWCRTVGIVNPTTSGPSKYSYCHQRDLTREERMRLDEERVGFWDRYREYNLANGVARPLPLVVMEGSESPSSNDESNGEEDVSGEEEEPETTERRDIMRDVKGSPLVAAAEAAIASRSLPQKVEEEESAVDLAYMTAASEDEEDEWDREIAKKLARRKRMVTFADDGQHTVKRIKLEDGSGDGAGTAGSNEWRLWPHWIYADRQVSTAGSFDDICGLT